jgi:hypothetical protein
VLRARHPSRRQRARVRLWIVLNSLRYDAVFALDDPDALVGAGLSCPACLEESTRLSIGVADGVPDARCDCTTCGNAWSLDLAPQQLLRLSLDPPTTAEVRWSRRLPASLLPPLDDDFED